MSDVETAMDTKEPNTQVKGKEQLENGESPLLSND